jgi:hypothetical protein
MRRPPTLALLLVCLALGCGSDDASRVTWKDVESAQSRYQANAGSLEDRQAYIDILSAFLAEHPGHQRASRLFLEEEVAFARTLAERGRFASAISYYEDAVARAPHDDALKAELEEIRGKVSVSRDRFEQLGRNMTRDEVRDLLGAPRPGWTRTLEKAGRTYETWYYKRSDGGLASVSFAGDRILVAEYGEILTLD